MRGFVSDSANRKSVFGALTIGWRGHLVAKDLMRFVVNFIVYYFGEEHRIWENYEIVVLLAVSICPFDPVSNDASIMR